MKKVSHNFKKRSRLQQRRRTRGHGLKSTSAYRVSINSYRKRLNKKIIPVPE